jgi:hypothetical protein
MRQDGLATMSDGPPAEVRERLVGLAAFGICVSAATITKGTERDEISDFRGSVGDLNVSRVTRFQQQPCRLH